MSKDGSSKRPVPENAVERFMGMVWVMAEMCGVDDIPEVFHHVELLGESVTRHVFESTHKISPQKKVGVDRKRFIAIFKNRYQQTLDLEYTRAITPVEAKMINQVNKNLRVEGFSPDDYLAWVFDEFLVENPKFRPPNIKSMCSQHVTHTFFIANKEVKDAKKRQNLDKTAAMDLIKRARILLREEIDQSDKEIVTEGLKSYKEKRIMLSELRKTIEGLEKKVKKN